MFGDIEVQNAPIMKDDGRWCPKARLTQWL
jgi:hypothetical protein